MRVKDCEGCEHCIRKVWSSSYKPANYHPVGVSHAYHYCDKHKKRCLEVKFCCSYLSDNPGEQAYKEHLDLGG